MPMLIRRPGPVAEWLILAPLPLSTVARRCFPCRSRQCLQVLATRSTLPPTLLGVVNPRHFLTRLVIRPQRMLCHPQISLMLSRYTHVNVIRCLRRACSHLHLLVGAATSPRLWCNSPQHVGLSPTTLALSPIASRFLASLALSRHCL